MAKRVSAKAKDSGEARFVGYARVSTNEQNLDMQIEALKKAGVLDDNLHVEKLSACARKRKALDLALKDLREGDTLCVWKLDRLGRSLRDLLNRSTQIQEAGANLISLTQGGIDTRTSHGKLFFNMLAVFAEFERDLTIDRTRKGIATRREKGGSWGADVKLTEEVKARVRRLMKRKVPIKVIAKRLRISQSLLWNNGFKYTKYRPRKAA
jgi:DNA invertase Pin-like site-specific DNA recombinase